ncbi:putative murein peptide carboxypeptidase [Candidatus Entotheonellaceae bacterium PAL068K]
MSLHNLVCPPALRAGDCIGLAAPASSFDRRALRIGIEVLQAWGFRVHHTSRIFDRHRYLAGTDAARAAELQALFTNPEIKAIFCCRGGYGSQRLLPYLDSALIATHPKIFVGYSDLTSLLLYLYSRCRLITFHGPVVAGDLHRGLTPAVQRQLKGVLAGDPETMQPAVPCQDDLIVLQAGEAEGILLGGCLSLFVCAVGTPFQPDTRGAILFFEDRGERLYVIDRMLTYLRLAGVFEGVRGFVFSRIEPVEADRDLPYDVQDVILDVLRDLRLPLLYGFPAGHCQQPLTLPFGVRAAICDGRLVLCDVPVVGSEAS